MAVAATVAADVAAVAATVAAAVAVAVAVRARADDGNTGGDAESGYGVRRWWRWRSWCKLVEVALLVVMVLMVFLMDAIAARIYRLGAGRLGATRRNAVCVSSAGN